MNPPDKALLAIQLLDLPARFSRTDLTSARREQLQVWHPDRFLSNEHLRRKAEDRTKRINEACDYLQSMMRGDIFEWVQQHTNGDRSHQSISDLLRQNRELQRLLSESRKQHEEAMSLVRGQHASAVSELKRQHTNREEAIRSQSEHEQAELVKRCALLEIALSHIEAEKRRNTSIHAYFTNYLLSPMRQLVLSITTLTQKAWIFSDNYLKQNVPNNTERVTLAIMLLFFIGLALFVFCLAMPKSLLITLTCVLIVGGSGHMILTSHRPAPNHGDAKKRK